MCGIAGIWHLDNKKLTTAKLQRFTDSLLHRGPDAGCYWIDNKRFLGLGHRRLSILDLSSDGNQPMSFDNGRYRIVYNGEVFNFLELRSELESRNYHFTTESDTEVILAAYDYWGHACLNKFNGMWAFAIWDNLKQSLFLARDRFGIKPLYYMYRPDQLFAFASETYSFKFLDGFTRNFNRGNLAYNIVDHFGLEAHGHTIFEDIYQLLPGHCMEFSYTISQVKQKRWWSTLSATMPVQENYERQVEHFRELFFDAVKLRLRSDVPVASALSGGLDSSSVYCALYHVMNNTTTKERIPANWQKAFVATFPGSSIDERRYAEQVINFTKGRVQYIEPDYSNLPKKIIDSTLLFDSIYLTPVIVAGEVYRTMNLQRIKVSLDGHGVDEMLFGYPGMLENVLKVRLNGSLPVDNDLLNTILDMYSPEDRNTIRTKLITQQGKSKTTIMRDIGRKITPARIKAMLSKYGIAGNEFGLALKKPLHSLSHESYQTSDLPAELRIPFEAFHTGILPTILRNFDRISMQHSIEIRMPFMDYRLVSFVFSLPFSSKVGAGFSKRIVRDAMKGFIPETIRARKWKVGFNAPMNEWFSGELSEFIRDEINSSAFIQSDVWNGKKVRRFAEKKIKEKSWTWDACISFWPILNAHLLILNNKP
jgi:asparagine synthase (glutamine-hydrolysing)